MPIVPKRQANRVSQGFQAPQEDSRLARFQGEQIAKFGQIISNGGEMIQQYQASKQKSDAAITKMRSRSFAETLGEQANDVARRNAVDTNGSTMVADFDSAYSENANEYLNSIDKDLRPIAEAEIMTARNAYRTKLFLDAREQDLKWKADQVEESLGERTKLIYNNPDLLEDHREDFSVFSIKGLQLNEAEGKKYTKFADKNFVYAAVQGLTDKGKYSQAEELIKKNADLFGVGKGIGESDGFGSTEDLIDEVREERSRALDLDAKLERREDRAREKRAKKLKEDTNRVLSERVGRIRESGDIVAQRETIEYIDTLVGQKLVTPLEGKFLQGSLSDFDNEVEDSKELLVLTAKINSTDNTEEIERSIMASATAGDISYANAERLLNISRRKAGLKVDSKKMALAENLISSRLENELTSSFDGPETKINALIEHQRYIEEGLDPIAAAKKVIKEFSSKEPTNTINIDNGPTLDLSYINGLNTIDEVTEAARKADAQFRVDRNAQKLEAILLELDRRKRKLENDVLTEGVE